VITTAPDGETTSTTTVFGVGDKEATVSVDADGEVIGGGGLRANVRAIWGVRPSVGDCALCVLLCGGLLIGAVGGAELRCPINHAAGQPSPACGHDPSRRACVACERRRPRKGVRSAQLYRACVSLPGI
jgi:hypothetical protein